MSSASTSNLLPSLRTLTFVLVTKENRKEDYECLKITSYSENTRAFIKIQDGCNNFCSYCIIPYTRGNFRSRPKEEIFSEIKSLCDRGFLEVVLTGIDSAGYGKEFKDSNYRFNDLLKEIIEREPRLKRISPENSQISHNAPIPIENKIIKTKVKKRLWRERSFL